MKLNVLVALCLFLLLIISNESLGTRRGKIGWLPKVFTKPSKTKPRHDSRSKESIIKKSKERSQSNQESYNQQPGGYPQQPGRGGSYPNQGGYPQQPGGYPNQGSYPQQPGGYPQQPGRGGYPNQGNYPQQPGGYPNQGHYPQQPGGYPNQGSYPQQPGGYPNQGYYPRQPGAYPQQPYQGGYPQPGYPAGGYPHMGGHGYPWGNINHNPNNRILSPHYGSSFGYGGFGGGVGGGSPFSNSAKAMGFAPSDKSKGFGRSAAMAAAGGAVAGMALGYGLGRFPRPHFHFRSPQEEYYYNYYMYQRHSSSSSSSDINNYNRDYQHRPPPVTFHQYMEACMKRSDLLPAESPRKQKPATPSARPTTNINTTVPSVPAGGNNTTSSNTTSPTLATLHPEVHPTATDSVKVNTTSVPVTSTSNNSTATQNATSSQPQFELSKVLQPVHDLKNAASDDDDDTVSIMEIGYPALIKQMKVKRCTEMYIVYTEKHLENEKKKIPQVRGGAQGLEMDPLQGLLIEISGLLLMLLSNNMPLQMHGGFH
ncbi:trithorax group protein osa-like isoform X3 [Gouania willdenowi]|uniref:trithorax group protein osa-like isoform X3 n=1 Tax=Gouania willdenowi TaxID=441366 RepID=UPI0010548ADC|nr:trithorax group protein osa-like isoform X3 [Gouania willdenowi]